MEDALSHETNPAAMRRRGGRPALPDTKRRRPFVGYRATLAERAELQAWANEAGVSVSAVIRAAVHAYLGKAGPAIQRARPWEFGPVVVQLQRLGNTIHQILREARFGHFPPSTARAADEALEALTAYWLTIPMPADDSET